MKELFREPDFTIVGYYRTVLEGEGIRAVIRNEHLNGNFSDVPIPDFFPALCVVDDEEYERALHVIRDHRARNLALSEFEVPCPGCSESNPGNFESCWNCGAELPAASL